MRARPPSARAPAPEELATQFDLNLLRVLDALLVTRGVSSAARRLGLSQSATSGALARLRQVFHDPLLVRSGNRMRATPLAEQLHPRISTILAELQAAMEATHTFDPASSQRRLRIGVTDYTAQVVLPALVADLRRQAPGMVIETLPIDRDRPLLATREADLLIADDWTVRDERDAVVLFREHFLCIARADHARLGEKVLLADYVEADHALIAPRGLTPGVVDAALAPLGLQRRVAVTVPYYLAAPALIADSDLVLTLPARLAAPCRHVPGLRLFPPPLEVPGFNVVCVAHPRSSGEAAIRWLQDRVITVAQRSFGLRYSTSSTAPA